MKKSDAQSSPKLTVTRDVAEGQIQQRLEIGRELVRYTTQSNYNNSDGYAKYKKWDDYNEELLKRIFDTTEVYEEYSHFVVSMVFSGRPLSEEEKRRNRIDEINKKLLRLESIKERLELIPEKIEEVQTKDAIANRQVFIVHGHDESVKNSVARFVEKLELKAIILSEQIDLGRTVIEKFEANSDVAYVIVLLTPDDLTYSAQSQGIDKERARQNVIFELGYFYGKLGRGKVCLIRKGETEIPSDLSGIVYKPYDGDWQLSVAREIHGSGIPIDLNRLLM